MYVGENLKETIKSLFEAGVTPYLEGAPGVGKTELIYQLAKEMGVKCYVLVLSHYRRDDISGLPYLNAENKVEFSKPPMIPAPDEKAILFLDEITTVEPELLGMAYKIVAEKNVGVHRFENSYVICAGNPESYGGYEIPPPLINRLVKITVTPSKDEWIKYILRKHQNEVATKVTSFIEKDESYLLKYEGAGKSFASPRSWENLIKVNNLDKDIVHGTIGEGTGAQFLAYLKFFNKLPDIEKIVAGEEVPLIEKDISVCYALIGMLITRVKSQDEFKNTMKYLNKNYKQGIIPADLLVTFLKRLISLGKKVDLRISEVEIVRAKLKEALL